MDGKIYISSASVVNNEGGFNVDLGRFSFFIIYVTPNNDCVGIFKIE